MVKYLNGDFTPADFASCGIGFSGSAKGGSRTESFRIGRASGGKVDDYQPTHEPADQPDTIDVDAEADRLRGGGDFATRLNRMRPLSEPEDRMPNPGTDYRYDPNKTRNNEINRPNPAPDEIQARKGGRIKRAAGGYADDPLDMRPGRRARKFDKLMGKGSIDVDTAADVERRNQGLDRRLNESDDDADPRMPTTGGGTMGSDKGELNRTNPPVTEVEARKGGRIKRAIGGVIPGQAPSAGMQPMTRQPTQVPMGGQTDDPLARASVSMPVEDVGRLAIRAAGAGAKGAMGAMSQLAARNSRGTPPRVMPGASAIAPAAVAPQAPAQGGPGVPLSVRKGGRIRRDDGGPVNPGGKTITTDDWGAPGGISDQFAAQVPRPGGNRSLWPNLQSQDPELERHLRYMEAGEARNSASENEHEIATGKTLPIRANDPEARARYHGFSKGGALTAAKRHALPSSSFALPGKGSGSDGKGSGSYPINDASHARNALARVSQYGSPAEKSRVRAAVHRKFPDIGKG